jgi:hypothetical protein
MKCIDLPVLAFLLGGIAASPTLALAQTYIEFDVPNSGTIMDLCVRPAVLLPRSTARTRVPNLEMARFRSALIPPA